MLKEDSKLLESKELIQETVPLGHIEGVEEMHVVVALAILEEGPHGHLLGTREYVVLKEQDVEVVH